MFFSMRCLRTQMPSPKGRLPRKSLRSLIDPSDKVIEPNPCPVVVTIAECFAEDLLVEKYVHRYLNLTSVSKSTYIPSDRATAAFRPPACPREIRCGGPSPSRSTTTLETLMAYQHEIHWGNAELTCSLCSNCFFCFWASRLNCSYCSSKSVFSELTSV